MRPEYLYLHVPFCARRCTYCDFAVTALREPPVELWLDAIIDEFGLVSNAEGWDRPLQLETLYIGGGTPSLLGPGAMTALRTRMRGIAEIDEGTEWTVEANPESFDDELARDWQRAGVNRLSLGVQSFDEGVLRWMGRLHGPDGPGRAIRAARRAGITNYSLDLIFGLPARLERDWKGDIERLLALEPKHISLYGLTAEPATPLGRWVEEGRERLADDERYREEFLYASERLQQEGFLHYEVSNFARPGHESRHNQAYWSGEPYLGLGPSAHSFLPPLRRWNLRGWEAYRRTVAEGRSPVEDSELVGDEMARLERLWLGLRVAEGIEAGPEGWTPGEERVATRWVDEGWAIWEEDRLRLTPEGWLLLDELVIEFDRTSGVPT